jgi:hypothetical protein
VIANGGIRVGGQVVEKHITCSLSLFDGSSLLGGDFIERVKDGGVYAAGIVREQTRDLLNAVDTSFVKKRGEVGGGELYLLTVGWRSPEMRRMLGFGGGSMFQLLESFGDIIRHLNIDKPFVVMPIESEAKVAGISPVFGDGVPQGKGIEEVIGIGDVEIFDAKIINCKGEGQRTSSVSPETRGMSDGEVTMWGKMIT